MDLSEGSVVLDTAVCVLTYANMDRVVPFFQQLQDNWLQVMLSTLWIKPHHFPVCTLEYVFALQLFKCQCGAFAKKQACVLA